MQKHRLLLSCFLLFTLLFVQCDKPPLTVRLGNVYVAGGEMINYGTDSSYSIAKLWVDGIGYNLPSDAPFPQAEEVFVEKTDVYVAGSEYGGPDSRAVLWKNMRRIHLSKVGDHAQAHSLFVSNKDVYVSGSVYRNGKLQIVVWKNGVEIPLNYESTFIWSLFVDNNNVYATGSHKLNGVVYPAIYKNGQPQVLQVPANYEAGEVSCVYVSKGNVYAVGNVYGSIYNDAVVWVNGKYTKLEGSGNVWANGIVVSATNDVYASGMLDGSCVVWKNGKILYRDNRWSAAGYSIALSGKDIYVTGSIEEAVLWKNNTAQLLPVKKGTGYAYSVFVR